MLPIQIKEDVNALIYFLSLSLSLNHVQHNIFSFSRTNLVFISCNTRINLFMEIKVEDILSVFVHRIFYGIAIYLQ
jgi:hypothetical protein